MVHVLVDRSEGIGMWVSRTPSRHRARGQHRRRLHVFRGFLALATSIGLVSGSQAALATTQAKPWFGVLQPSSTSLHSLERAGVTRAVLSLSWASYETSENVYNNAYLDQVKVRAAQLSASGLSIVLDVGLQYPPSWVFSLPGQTRFENQYGQTWHAALGSDVPNAVFNPAVRQSEADYIKRLGVGLAGVPIVAVRVGGLLQGELRYPPAKYGSSTTSLWMFDPAALDAAPYPGWRPGSGTVAEATSMLKYYTASLTGYESFLLKRFGTALPKAQLELLLPGWGLRPGQLQAAAAGRASGRSDAERGNDVANGTDWPSQVAALASFSKTRTEVYTTWLDAAAWGTTTASESPVEYLAQLAKPYGLPVSGENTGTQSVQALTTCLDRVRTLHLAGMMWMQGGALVNGGPVTLSIYSAKIAASRSGR